MALLRRRAPRGVTLIELVVATTIASVITASAVASVASIQRFIIDAQESADLDAEAKLLVEYLVSSSQGLGGGAFRPWTTVRVENNWDPTDKTDRVTLMQLDENFSECAIKAHPGMGSTLQFEPTGCCVDASWNGKQILVTGPNGTTYVNRTVNGVSTGGGVCEINMSAGIAGATYGIAPTTALDLPGGAILVVDVQRVWLDSSRNVLVLDRDTDGDGTFEQIDIADAVYDFQAALGYDVDRDGHIVTTGSSADEWLFNGAGDTFTGGGLVDANVTDLRMVIYGITMGTDSRVGGNQITLLDGVPKTSTGILLRGTLGRALFRNLALFEL